MSSQFRVSQQRLQRRADLINDSGLHKVTLCFTQGCGTYLIFDGVDYAHKRRDGTFEGISNKKCYEILENALVEAIHKYMEEREF